LPAGRWWSMVDVSGTPLATVADGVGEPAPVVAAEHGDKVFNTRAGDGHAARDGSLRDRPGETLGLGGESGSGKSTVARLLMGLLQPTSGTVRLDSVDLSTVRGAELRRLRAHMQIVFQNPYGSLLPHYSAVANVAEPLRLHDRGDKAWRR